MLNSPHSLTPVASALRAFIPQAVDRLNYLHPQVHFEACTEGVKVFGEVSEEVRRDISYTLHRAKIAEEARPLREMLYRSALL